MTETKRILFLCKGNAARSQMAEAVIRHIGGQFFDAFSAGTNPVAAVHPQALETLSRNRVPPEGPEMVRAFEDAFQALERRIRLLIAVTTPRPCSIPAAA